MASKRARSPELVSNPFVKRRNLEWSLELTGSPLDAETDSSEDLSPARLENQQEENHNAVTLPTAAAVEAGEAEVTDHLSYFSTLLTKAILDPYPATIPNLATEHWRALYASNCASRNGAHFVVQQHDHPIAGTHYDLRLQINETSSVSWAIMYGLPGDPNSRRLNRNATETRVHCLWNHLIETASVSTGSMIIWDTGTYEVLDRRSKYAPKEDPDSQQMSGAEDLFESLTQQEKLHQAFQTRKIRIRLNGTRLPKNYVLNLRLTKDEDVAGRAKSGRTPKTRRRRGGSKALSRKPEPTTSSSESEIVGKTGEVNDDDDETVNAPVGQYQEGVSAMEREIRELEDEQVRKTNAYTGATNSIGSMHQRKWFLSMDREACGFLRQRKGNKVFWERDKEEYPIGDNDQEGRLTFPFYVRGIEVETSIITGRHGADVLRDEGVGDFVRRKGWQAVLS